jgi:hypothetical protein
MTTYDYEIEPEAILERDPAAGQDRRSWGSARWSSVW